MALNLDLQNLVDEFMSEAKKLIASYAEPHVDTVHPAAEPVAAPVAEVPEPAPAPEPAPVVAPVIEPAPAPLLPPDPIPPAA